MDIRKKIQEAVKEFKNLSEDECIEITLSAKSLSLEECYDSLLIAPTDLSAEETKFAEQLHKYGRAIGVKDLLEASALLGASRLQTIVRVLMPNLKRGLMVAFFISIAFLIGEFVFINILSGGHMETIQIYLYSLKNRSGHLSSAVVISYFIVMLLITLLVSWLSREKKT